MPPRAWSQDCLTVLGMQALPALAESLSILEMGGSETATDADQQQQQQPQLSTLYLNIGLQVRGDRDLLNSSVVIVCERKTHGHSGLVCHAGW